MNLKVWFIVKRQEKRKFKFAVYSKQTDICSKCNNCTNIFKNCKFWNEIDTTVVLSSTVLLCIPFQRDFVYWYGLLHILKQPTNYR